MILNIKYFHVSEDLINFIKTLPCIVCGQTADDAHHIKTKKSGGKDIPENLIPLTRDCHSLWHLKGTKYMAETYPTVKKWLDLAGWKLEGGKWRLYGPV
jgi:5-methylcytosine-specific restriction endonuclease McrA